MSRVEPHTASGRPMTYDEIAPSYDRRYEQHDYEGVRRAVLDFVGSGPGLAVLEVGCGTGHWLAAVASRAARVAGVDPSLPMLERARSAAPATLLVQGRAEALPWRAGSFDRIFCVNALHHFTDPAAFFREARHVLRPGAGLMTVGLDPHVGDDRWWVYEHFPAALPADRERYPSTDEIRRLLTEAGFTRCETRVAQHVSEEAPLRDALSRGLLEPSATSQLRVIGDEAYEKGVRRLHEAQAELGGEDLMLRADLRLRATVGWVEVSSSAAIPEE